MNKFLFLILGCLVHFCAFAQYADKQEDDGSRIIISDYETLYSKWNNAASMALQYAKIDDGQEFWSLDIILNEGRPTIEEGRVLLIKFEDNSVMELKNRNTITSLDAELITSRYGSWYTVNPIYNITPEQLEKLRTQKVTKIRIEFDGEYIGRDIKSKNFTKTFNKQYDQVSKRLSVSNNVRDGF